MFWEGDHHPRHVHVYRDGKLIVKWDLENSKAMKGEPNRQILKYIGEMRREGRI